MNRVSPWRTIPRRTIGISLLAAFFTFSGIGFIGDIFDLGRQPALKLAISVVLSGFFAVCYTISSIALRGKFWKACIPIFAAQFGASAMLALWLPEPGRPNLLDSAGLARLSGRIDFDGVCTIIAVCLGYTGLIIVSVSEGRRYARGQAEKASLEAEMAAARQIQQVILPDAGTAFPGYKVESVYKPAQQVGGDFFQILPAAGGGLLVVVGDVAGKGLPAAMLVSMLVGSIRATAGQSCDPALMLGELHERLLGRAAGGFSTALVACIAADGAVTIANAGHLSPYLDGQEMELPGALPLGIEGAGGYEVTRFELQAGSRLTFLSDGVVEAMNERGELLGFDRARAISTKSAAAIADEAVRFGQSDDITVVTIERRAE